jgi:putative hydrolase of the HAD superfamily
MPLMLRDLDNTLVDRAAVFRRWAVSFAAGFGGGTAEADWLVAADPDGLESRERLALMISRRLGLDGARKEGWWRNCAGDGRPHRGGPGGARGAGRAAGWISVVVTRGTRRNRSGLLRRWGRVRVGEALAPGPGSAITTASWQCTVAGAGLFSF